MANALTNAALPAGWLLAGSPEARAYYNSLLDPNEIDPVSGNPYGINAGRWRPDIYNALAPISERRAPRQDSYISGDNEIVNYLPTWSDPGPDLWEQGGAVNYAYNPQTHDMVGVDANGNLMPGVGYNAAPNDQAFWNAAMLAAGVVGGATAGWAGAGGAGADAAAMADSVYAGSSAGSIGGTGATEAAAAAGGAGAGGGAAAAAPAGAGGGGMGSYWGQIAGGLISGAIQSNAASSAAKTQAGATQAGIDEQRRQYDQTRQDFTPWREAGQRALGSLEQDIGRMPTPDEVMADPGYQFGMNQGMQAIDRRLAAIGGRRSGAAAKAGARFATDYASTQYGAAYQRRQDRLNRLAALAGIGQTATGASAAAGQNARNAITGLISSQGDAAAANRMYQGNIWGNAVNQTAAAWGRSQQPQWQPQQFGPTWQQQGGPMDYGSYGEYGNLGGP